MKFMMNDTYTYLKIQLKTAEIIDKSSSDI